MSGKERNILPAKNPRIKYVLLCEKKSLEESFLVGEQFSEQSAPVREKSLTENVGEKSLTENVGKKSREDLS